jgi:signal transduction histidine kinase
MNPILAWADLHHYGWLQVPAWVFDLEPRRYRWVNPAGLLFWHGESESEFLSRDLSDATPVAVARLQSLLEQAQQGKIVREQWTLYPRDQPVTSELLARGIWLPDGRLGLFFASEPLAASYDPAALRGMEAVRHTPVRIALHPIDGGPPLMRNPAATTTFGVVSEEADAPSFAALFNDPELPTQILEHARSGQVHTGEALLNTQSGLRWHAIDTRAVRDPVTGHAVLQFNARDISDLKTALAALESARDAAEAASRAKSSFLANMSHEIRTPMNGVIGLTQLLLNTPLQARQRQYVELALSSAKALMQIINDILDLSKVEAGKFTLNPQPMSLRETLDQALAPLQVQAATRQLQFDWSTDADVPDAVVADGPRWRQILLNLAGNALKFTETGHVRVHVQRRDSDPHQLLLACAVHDSGIGMTAEQLALVFEPFTQADASVTRRYGGTGLGLSIVQRLVQLMGGHVEAESSPGQGSCFRFIVPVALITETAGSP